MTRSPPSILCTIFSGIQLMQFFLHMAYEDSHRSYGSSCGDLPFQGVCQGNGASPALWLAISITLNNMLCSNGHLAIFQTLISSLSASQVFYMLMIVTWQHTPHPTPQDWLQPFPNYQHNITLWQGSLQVTGGNLSFKKCSWSILAMHKQGHKWFCPHTICPLPGQLSVQNSQNTSINIHFIEPSHGLEVVGVVQSLSGNSAPAAQALKEKTQQWITALQSGFLPKTYDVDGAGVIWPTLQYPLSVTTMSPCQLQ